MSGGEVSLSVLQEGYISWCKDTDTPPAPEIHEILRIIAQKQEVAKVYINFPYVEAKMYFIWRELVQEGRINDALHELLQLSETGFIPAKVLYIEILLGRVETIDDSAKWIDESIGLKHAFEILSFVGEVPGGALVREKVVEVIVDYSMYGREDDLNEEDVISKIEEVLAELLKSGGEEEAKSVDDTQKKIKKFIDWVSSTHSQAKRPRL